MRKYCKWVSWDEVLNDEEIQLPPDTDHYNGPHELKPGEANGFNTVLLCIFECTTMHISFFKYLLIRTISIHENTLK